MFTGETDIPAPPRKERHSTNAWSNGSGLFQMIERQFSNEFVSLRTEPVFTV